MDRPKLREEVMEQKIWEIIGTGKALDVQAEELLALIPDIEEARHQKEIKELIRTYDTYVKALEDENGSLVGLAYTHGWRSSEVEFGKKCRNKIKVLKHRKEK